MFNSGTSEEEIQRFLGETVQVEVPGKGRAFRDGANSLALARDLEGRPTYYVGFDATAHQQLEAFREIAARDRRVWKVIVPELASGPTK